MSLMFELGTAKYDFDHDVFILAATANGAPIRVAVSREALSDYSKSSLDPTDPMALFNEWEYPMRELAAAKFARGEFEPGGSILVRSGDGF